MFNTQAQFAKDFWQDNCQETFMRKERDEKHNMCFPSAKGVGQR